jgi:hypothetical protein
LMLPHKRSFKKILRDYHGRNDRQRQAAFVAVSGRGEVWANE